MTESRSARASSKKSKPRANKYSDQQLELIRRALCSLRSDAYSGERLSWNAITDSINESVGCHLNYKYVQKFVEGIPHGDPDKRLYGIKKYQRSIQGDGLDHIVKYFKEDNESRVFFDIEAFDHCVPERPIWPTKLTEYLRGPGDNPLAIDLKLLPYEFELSKGESESFRLVFQLVNNGCHTAFAIYARSDDQLVSPLVAGWGIVTSEDNMILLGKERGRDNETWSFITLAFDNRWRTGLSPKSLVLRKAGLPIDDQIIDDFSDELCDLLIDQDKTSLWFCKSPILSSSIEGQ